MNNAIVKRQPEQKAQVVSAQRFFQFFKDRSIDILQVETARALSCHMTELEVCGNNVLSRRMMFMDNTLDFFRTLNKETYKMFCMSLGDVRLGVFVLYRFEIHIQLQEFIIRIQGTQKQLLEALMANTSKEIGKCVNSKDQGNISSPINQMVDFINDLAELAEYNEELILNETIICLKNFIPIALVVFGLLSLIEMLFGSVE